MLSKEEIYKQWYDYETTARCNTRHAEFLFWSLMEIVNRLEAKLKEGRYCQICGRDIENAE